MFKKVSIFFFLLFFIFQNKTFAATFTFSNTPSSIQDNQSFSVNVSLSINGSSGNIYYIKGDFASVNSSTSYLGFTKDNFGNWYNGKPTLDYTKLFKITMDSSNQWSGAISFKPDASDSGYKGPGNYNFKLRRYTSTGNSYTWSDATVQLAITSSSTPTPTPTPTPIPVPTSKSSSSPTPTESPATSLISPTENTPVAVELATSTSPNPTSISINLFDNLKATASSKSVLPASAKASSLNSTPISKQEKFLADKEIPSRILIAFGFIMLILSAGLFIKSFKR